MTLEQMHELMASIKSRLEKGEISLEEAERLRAPIKEQIARDGAAPP